MKNAVKVLGLSNDIIAPLERPLGPVQPRSNVGLLGRLMQKLGLARNDPAPSGSRYAIQESKPKFGEVFLAVMVLGFSAHAWNSLQEQEQQQLLQFLRQMPASHPDANAINHRYALLKASGLVSMPVVRV